jgi:SAM-dependent methyltransferase
LTGWASRPGPRSRSAGFSASSRPTGTWIPSRSGRRCATARAGPFLRATRTGRRRGPGRVHARSYFCRRARHGQHAPEFLRGEKTGEEILFSPARLPLWFDYFSNDNLLYQINNRLGAEAVFRALPHGRRATVVEIGGGSGSAALAVAERLLRDASLERIGRYVFSEIVPTFLRRAERALKARCPGLSIEYLRLDMDRDFDVQGVPRGIADVVYSVNTVHIARDLNATLARIRETLKPGGAAVFSECVRPFAGQPIYVEFVFNFLENFTGVATDAATRPNHGFLTPDNWRKAFEKAGFEKPEILPNVEELARHYDSFFVAAVTARRPT